jgi:hypothetical protein
LIPAGPDDREREPEYRTPGQQERRAVRKTLHERSDGQERAAGDRQPAGADPVGEHADRDCRQHGHERRGREHSAHLHVRELKLPLQQRQQRHDRRLAELYREGERVDEEDEPSHSRA